MTKVCVLGTSCMVPTKDRNASAVYIERDGVGVLFDCGEGTQRQMNIASIPRTKVRYIFVSHWHADHTAGLLGLIQTIGSSLESPEIDLYGPTGTKEIFRNLMSGSVFDNRVNVKVHELNCPKVKQVMKTSSFKVAAVNLYHGIPSVGYRFEESPKRKIKLKALRELGVPEGPLMAQLQSGVDVEFDGRFLKSSDYTYSVRGKAFTYVPDTAYTPNAVELATDTNVLMAESTYMSKHKDRAKDYFHMTSEEAAQIASMSGAKKLILTHFSQRYKELDELLDEARVIFPNSELAFDFMKFNL